MGGKEIGYGEPGMMAWVRLELFGLARTICAIVRTDDGLNAVSETMQG